MTNLHNISRTSCILLAVALGACTPENGVTTEGDTETGSDTETTDPSSPSMPTTMTTPTMPTSMTTPTDPTSEPTETATVTESESATETATDTATESATDTATATDTDTDTGDTTGEPVAELSAVWATANPAGLAADLLVGLAPGLDAQTAAQKLLGDVVSIQSVAYATNDAFITYDAPGGTGGVLIMDNLPNNIMAAPIGLGSRRITGPATGLIAPKGVEATGPGGLILVADTGAAGIHAFESNAEGDVGPVFTVTDIGTAEGVWDIHYDSKNDVLYAAATNGEVLVYENFAMEQGAVGPTRTIVPTEAGEKISVNLHGITLDGTNLYVTDVGDPADLMDGQIFVIADADTAEGDVDVLQRIQGGDLGNPVDIELRPGAKTTLYVAEKGNDKLLVYREEMNPDEFELLGELAVTKPESVAIRTGTTLFVAQNDAGIDTDGLLLVNTPAMGNLSAGAALTKLGSINSVQSLALSLAGLGYVGFDGPSASGGGGVFMVDALTGLVGDGELDATVGRLWGPETGIVTPKGMALNLAGDRLFIADTEAANIKIFDTGNFGNVEPLFVFDDLGGGPVWDIAYDDASDRLYAAGTDGVVRVFDDALANMGSGAPSRTITPTDGQAQISVNLHGIHFDPISKVLIVSDVGDPMSATDGQIFLIADADTADGEVAVLAAIGGETTMLGNPVDVAFDGANLFVAEKSNSMVLRFDGILDFTGNTNDLPADAMAAVANPESVQLFFALP